MSTDDRKSFIQSNLVHLSECTLINTDLVSRLYQLKLLELNEFQSLVSNIFTLQIML